MLMSAVEEKALPGLRLNPSLPPATNPIPAWSRRRLLRRERLKSLPPPPTENTPRPPSSPKSGGNKGLSDRKDENSANFSTGVDPFQRIFQLERNLRFLREQHQVVLSSLQNEVEELKAQNKALQFQLVMGSDLVTEFEDNESSDASLPIEEDLYKDKKSETSSSNNSASSTVVSKNDKAIMTEPNNPEEFDFGLDPMTKLEKLHMENQELRSALHDARNRNVYLVALIEQIKRRHAAEIQNKRPKPPNIYPTQVAMGSLNEYPVVYAHKFEEYEEVIQQIKRENIELQSELSRMKTTLREILSSNKWTPEAYMLVRSVMEERSHGRENFHRLPHIPIRNHEQSRRSSLPAISQQNYNSLQAMRSHQSLPSVPQQKSRSNPPNSARHDGRYKPSSSQKKQRSHFS